MDMVTLIQQQQQTLDVNNIRKEQDQNGAFVVPIENDQRAANRFQSSEVARTEIVAPNNGSVAGSSTQCSYIDDDNGDEETDVEEDGGWITELPARSAIVEQHQTVATANGDLVIPNADPSYFGDVCVKNSTDVHLGNKTFYKGPVTIKQFVYTNPALVHDSSNDLSASKGDGVTDVPVFSQDKLNKVKLWTWRCAISLCALIVILLVITVVVTIVYLTGNTDSSAFPVTQPPPEVVDSSMGGVNISSVRFINRKEWGAQPPAEALTPLQLPVPYVIISHTATYPCYTQSECTLLVRTAQSYHIDSKNWSDIGYNFLVGGDGLAYVGRSWNYVGAHAFNFNRKSIGISFIGTFTKDLPNPEQLRAAQKIIEIGVKTNKISSDYKLLGHRQVSRTASPGDALYKIIKMWPHWSPTP